MLGIRSLTIVGVGLIGGSAGLAARRLPEPPRVVGLGRSAGSLEEARHCGAIDAWTLDPAEAVRDADLVLVCTPVDRVAAQVRDLAPLCKPGAILTDAGSTKRAIVGALGGLRFVGGHPIAGSHRTGVAAARADLFVGKLVVLTPDERTDPEALRTVHDFWRSLGARTLEMTPGDHDAALAVTSHLPHLTAAALAHALPAEWAALTGTGFRDTTRLAAGDPGLWRAIFAENRAAVCDALDRLQAALGEFRAALDASDPERLSDWLTHAKQVRDELGSGDPPARP